MSPYLHLALNNRLDRGKIQEKGNNAIAMQVGLNLASKLLMAR